MDGTYVKYPIDYRKSASVLSIKEAITSRVGRHFYQRPQISSLLPTMFADEVCRSKRGTEDRPEEGGGQETRPWN